MGLPAHADIATLFGWGVTLPSSCAEPQLFFDTNATSGQRLYACESGVFVLQDAAAGCSSDGSGNLTCTSVTITPSATPTISFDDTIEADAGVEAKIVADATVDDNGSISLQVEDGSDASYAQGLRVYSTGGAVVTRLGNATNSLDVSEAGVLTANGSGSGIGFGVLLSGTNTAAVNTYGSGSRIVFNTTASGSAGMTGTATLAGDPTLATGSVVVGANGLIFEGTADGFESLLAVTDPTADRTHTLPNTSGVVQINNVTSTATAAGTTTLTNASTSTQIFTGSTTQNVDMPAVSTLNLGRTFYIVNDSTGVVTVRSSGTNTVATLTGGTRAMLVSNATTGTSAAVWSVFGTKASGTVALGTGAIGSTACATVATGTATGITTRDTIQWTPNADISAVTGYAPVTTGALIIYPYPTTDTVNFKVCNPTSSSITPGAVTLNWRVAR